MKIQYRILSDILVKTLYVKAGSFDAVTHDRFMLMTAITFDVKVNWSSLLFGVLQDMVTPGSRQAKGFAIQICVLLKNVPGLVLGESSAFPASRVLTEKTVHMYVTINEKVGMEESADAPRVNKTPAKKTVSTKRPVGDGEEAPVVKKKRTTKGKPVVIAQDAVPLQIIKATTDAPTEQPPAPKRKSQKGKRRLILEGDDEIVDSAPEQPADDSVHDAIVVEPVAEQPAIAPVVEDTTDDPDAIIEQVLGQLDSVTTTDSEDQPAGTDAETIPWFDLPFVLATRDSERLFETTSDSEDDMDPDVGTQALPELQIDADDSRADATINSFISDPDEEMEPVVEEQSADEAMSLEDILMSIPVEVPLPSAGVEITKITMGKEIKIPGVDERTWYLASLPQIQVDVKGKELLVEKDPVKGNPVKEQILLILADIECLVKILEKVIDEEGLVLTWAEAESTGVALNRKRYILLKYREMLLRKFLEARRINFAPGDGSSTVDLKILDQLSDIHSFVLEELKKETQAHSIMWKKTCCSKFFEGRPRDRGSVIARTNTNTPSRCWIRTMLFVDGVWAVEPRADHWVKIPRPVVQNEVPRQRSYDDTLPPISLSARLDESQSDILSKLHTIEKGLRDSLQQQEEAFRTLIQGARQEGRTIDDVQTLRFNEFRKGVLAHSASVTADLMDIKKAVRELNAKVDAVSTRLDDVNKGVEATKEAISHQLLDFQAQAQANQNILTGQLSELVNYINRGGNDKKGEGSSRGPQPPPDDQNRDSGNAGGDTARSIVERLISADRERERSRGNRSGSYKRRY
ncbi:DNA topoisomerase III alpha (ISS) [Dorcoceras hygrometricum]|uniref:DNA topoisomerase III alpha (ISS) n=1 Tax=Dorcoceras hygrometricum TaxID=472368 RepID=A0A2Z7ANJ2_9LAMI|nr:DNA topoisomerase III alpha (ISS) [Dorcoceras hygrometricum]